MSFADILQNATAAAVQDVEVRTQVSPTFTYVPTPSGGPAGLPGGPSGPPSSSPPQKSILMDIIRPAVTVRSVAGSYTIAPWGEPERDYTPLLYLAGGLMVVGAFCTIRWLWGLW